MEYWKSRYENDDDNDDDNDDESDNDEEGDDDFEMNTVPEQLSAFPKKRRDRVGRMNVDMGDLMVDRRVPCR